MMEIDVPSSSKEMDVEETKKEGKKSIPGETSHQLEVQIWRKPSEAQIAIKEPGQPSGDPEKTYWHTLLPLIYRVPDIVREVDETAYTPRMVSIGPIHYGNKNLWTMTKHKQRYLEEYCRRRDIGEEWNEITNLDYWVKDQILECYEVDVMTDEYMWDAMVTDAVFIIELFLRFTSHDKSQYADDVILAQPWLRTAIAQDLILLENQLPFFILDKIYDLFSISPLSFLELANHFFSFYMPRKNVPLKQEMPLHFTDLVRRYWCLEHPPQHKAIRSLYRVTKLREAGVLIKPRQNACLLDIHFNRGSLEFPTSFTEGRSKWLSIISHFLFVGHLRRASLQIPPFEIDDNTETVLQNLIALEQSRYPYEAYISNYIILLDFLITSPEDADLLIEKNVIVSSLGNAAAVVEMVKRLSKQIVVVNSCYYPLAKMLNEHYNSYRSHPVIRFFKAWFVFTKAFFPALVVAQLCGVILMLYFYRR